MKIVQALWDGLRLRCPRCHQGRMFARFTMRRHCPVCDLPFEQASGEITGGMGINTVLTLFVIVVLACVFGFDPSVPLMPLIAALVLFAIVFPIAFYRSSRGLWTSFLYLMGTNMEPD